MDASVDHKFKISHTRVSGQKDPFTGTSLYAIKRKAKRLGWCLNCYREKCPSLISHCDTKVQVYYCYKRQFKIKGKTLVKEEDWILIPKLKPLIFLSFVSIR